MTDAAGGAIEIDGVIRSFGRLRVLRGVTATFEGASVHAIVGPNGCGKSTLLRILAGLSAFEQGSVRYGDVHRGPGDALPWSLRRRMGVLAHGSWAWPELTGRENLEVYARLYGEGPARVDEGLERYGVAGAARRPVGTWSRGMVQRLALARIWLQQPGLVLLDEPMTGLDAGTKERTLGELREWAESGRLVVIISHDPSVPQTLGARVHRMVDGRLEAAA